MTQRSPTVGAWPTVVQPVTSDGDSVARDRSTGPEWLSIRIRPAPPPPPPADQPAWSDPALPADESPPLPSPPVEAFFGLAPPGAALASALPSWPSSPKPPCPPPPPFAARLPSMTIDDASRSNAPPEPPPPASCPLVPPKIPPPPGTLIDPSWATESMPPATSWIAAPPAPHPVASSPVPPDEPGRRGSSSGDP